MKYCIVWIKTDVIGAKVRSTRVARELIVNDTVFSRELGDSFEFFLSGVLHFLEQANFVDPDSSSLDRRLQGNSLQQFPSAAEASQRDTTAPTQRQLAAEQAERSGQKRAPSPPRRSPSPTLKTISGVGIRRRSRSPKPASESLRVRSTSGRNSKVRSHDDAGLSPERTTEVDRLRDQFMHWFDGCLRPDSGLSPQCLWDAFARSDHHRHPQRRANAWPASSLMRCLKGRQGCCPPPCCE